MARAPLPLRSVLLLLSLAEWPLRPGASSVSIDRSGRLGLFDIHLASIFDSDNDGLSLLALRAGLAGTARNFRPSAASVEKSEARSAPSSSHRLVRSVSPSPSISAPTHAALASLASSSAHRHQEEAPSASSSSARRSHAASFPAPAAPARSALEAPTGANFVFEDHAPARREDDRRGGGGHKSAGKVGKAPSPALLAGAVCVEPDKRSARLALLQSAKHGSGLPPWPGSGAASRGGHKAAVSAPPAASALAPASDDDEEDGGHDGAALVETGGAGAGAGGGSGGDDDADDDDDDADDEADDEGAEGGGAPGEGVDLDAADDDDGGAGAGASAPAAAAAAAAAAPRRPAAAGEEAASEPLRIAYLIQVCRHAKLPLVRRVFRRLYSEDDTFLYLVDSQLLNHSLVKAALLEGAHPKASLPSNVVVQPAPHADYFYWPRVKVVLDGITSLLQSPRHWDFVVHLSESDYPVHSQSWLRSTLAQQRNSNFIRVMPRCMKGSRPIESDPSSLLDHAEHHAGDASRARRRGSHSKKDNLAAADSSATDALGHVAARSPHSHQGEDPILEDAMLIAIKRMDSALGALGRGRGRGTRGRKEPGEAAVKDKDDWYWWRMTRAVASCGDAFVPEEVPGVKFPLEGLERRGMIFARSPEWVVLTRELASYATGPGIENFQRLIGMHAGADEIYWATLVMNIPNFTQKLSRQGWYVKWPLKGNGHSPDTISDAHLPELMENRDLYLFTRKVDEVESQSVLQALDEAARDEEDGIFQDRAATLHGASSELEVNAGFELTLDRSQARCV